MPLLTILAAIDKHFSNSDDYDEIEFAFFGGEPFIAFDTMRAACERVWSHNQVKPYIFSATTNGTLVHGKIKEWLTEHKDKIWLVLSIDGTPEMHNLNRSASFDKIDVTFFRDMWPDQPVKMTVSQQTLPNLSEGVKFLHDLGFQVACNLAYGIDWSDPCNVYILSRELKKLVDYYLENPSIVPCGMLSMNISILGTSNLAVQKWCGVGTAMVAIDVDGQEYPCHMFMPISIGEKAHLSRQFDFTNVADLHSSICKNCTLLPICPTCYGSNFMEHGHLEIRSESLCNLIKIQALACSYFQTQKILRQMNLVPKNDDEALQQLMIIDAIRTIQSSVKADCFFTTP